MKFPTVVRHSPAGTYELSVSGKPRQFFDVWIDIDEVVHQAFLLARLLSDIPDLTIMPVLTGAGVFNTILGQKLNRICPAKPVYEVPVVARSYGAGMESGSLVIFSNWVQRDLIDGRNVLILDDIYDTGRTANEVTEYVGTNFHPLSIQRAFLIRKNQDQLAPVENDYFLFELPGANAFYAGMGMDWMYRYRNLDRVIDVKSGRLAK